MTRLRMLGWRIIGWLRRGRMEKEMDAEIQSHLAMQAEENERRGMPAEDARLAALRSFGNVDRVREQHREKHRLRILDQLSQDTRYAMRSLLRRPAHTLTAALCLAVGLTVSIVIFSIVISFFFGDQPGVSGRWSIVHIFLREGAEERKGVAFSLSDFRDFETTVPAIGYMAAETDLAVAAVGNHDPIGTSAAFVSGDYFALLQTQAQRGRLITRDDDRSGAPPVAVVSDYFWRTQLDASENAIGQPILVSGRSVVVVGVAPPRFHGLTGLEMGGDDSQGRQIWLPLEQSVGWPGAPPAEMFWLDAIARLRDGSTIEEAEAQLTAPAATLAARHPDWVRPQAVLARLGTPPDAGLADILLLILTFLSAPLAVLAVSCANVANLQLGRVTERVREIAIRVSFGATRTQVIRLLTIETIGFAGLSLVISTAATLWIFNILDGFFPRILSIDWRVALFSITLLMAVTFATGVAPAWIVLRRSTHDILKQTRQAGGAAHSRLRSALVVLQVGVSLAMLCGNGLFSQSLAISQLSVPPAMQSQLTADFDPRQVGASLSDPRAFSEELKRRLAADPRVKLVSLSRTSGVRYIMPGDDPEIRRFAPIVQITPDWPAMMEVTLLAGRALTEQDGAEAVLVSKKFADSFKDGGDILGALVRLQAEEHGETRAVQIVGIVSDNQMLGTFPGQTPKPTIYGAFLPAADPFTLWVRGENLNELSRDLRGIVRELEPNMAWLSLRRGEDIYLGDVPTLRYVALAIGGLGLLALVLAVIGLYAVMSYVVLLRRQEISVRMAVGAKSQDIVRMMLMHAARLVVVGSAMGLTLAAILALILRAVFVGMSGFEPMAFLPNIGLIVLATLIAASIPAYFAARLNPMQVLKED